jgi:hypothetical protein
MFHRVWLNPSGELSEEFVRAAREAKSRIAERNGRFGESLPKAVQKRLKQSTVAPIGSEVGQAAGD